MTVTISCKGIKKSYGEEGNKTCALAGIDLDVKGGELTLLVGPSGSGKTTLLSVMTTLLKPDEGSLFLLGKDVHLMNENERALFCRENLGIVFQSLFLIPTLTVLENVAIPLLIDGIEETIALQKASDILQRIHLSEKAHVSSDHLSKGQQQRVAIGRALISDARIIVCDEPTSSLDHVAGDDIMSFLHELAKTHAKTVFVVTHDVRIFRFADRIIHISDGAITSEEKT